MPTPFVFRPSIRSWLLLMLVGLGILLLAPGPAHAQDNIYVVKVGDTLATIAQRHSTSVSALLRLNSLADPNVIRVGQPLTLPDGAGAWPRATGAEDAEPAWVYTGPPTRVYVVRPADTIVSIAVKFATTPAHLAELNQRSSAAPVHVGEPLRVPEQERPKFVTQQGDDIPMAGKYYIHVVQPGESVAAIAQAYGTSMRRTLDVNAIKDPAALKPGERLVVPPPSYAELFGNVPIGEEGYPVYPLTPTDERWISVDLDHQRVWAWEGNKMVKSFAISSGKARTPTVTGVFRIWAKIATQTMEGGSRAAGDYYDLPNVQWVQYFYRDYSFHGTYWHNRFGTPMSHGCVNMTNEDARWLFEWASPEADGNKWIVSDARSPGTLVVVYQ